MRLDPTKLARLGLPANATVEQVHTRRREQIASSPLEVHLPAGLGVPVTAPLAEIQAAGRRRATVHAAAGGESHDEFMRRHFRDVKASTPTDPSTSPVQRPAYLDRPPSSAPASLTGPATPPVVTAPDPTPLHSAPATTPQQQSRRRLGFPVTAERARVDLTARQGGTGRPDFTWG